jgi:hypothetical protein
MAFAIAAAVLSAKDRTYDTTMHRSLRTVTDAALRAFMVFVVAAGVLALPQVVAAQYFGRNKVPWERFDFTILETEHFRIHYYASDSPTGEYVARLAERWYGRLAAFFDHEFREKKPLIIYQEHADFQQTRVTTGLIGEGTGGFTESLLDRVVLPLTGINADNDHVLGHELVHAFQFDIARRAAEEEMRSEPRRVPLWVTEGLAEYLSQGRYDPATAMWMRDAVAAGLLPRQEGRTATAVALPIRSGRLGVCGRPVGRRHGAGALPRSDERRRRGRDRSGSRPRSGRVLSRLSRDAGIGLRSDHGGPTAALGHGATVARRSRDRRVRKPSVSYRKSC